MAVTASRVVQFMPRLTHHSRAQLITTGTMISRGNRKLPCRSARTDRVANPNTDSAADLHAGLGAVDFDETWTICRARIARAGALDGRSA